MLLKFSTMVVIETVRSGSGIKLLREVFSEVFQKSSRPLHKERNSFGTVLPFLLLCCFTSFVDNKEARSNLPRSGTRTLLFLPDSCFLFSSGK